jgi:hypothetical protein
MVYGRTFPKFLFNLFHGHYWICFRSAAAAPKNKNRCGKEPQLYGRSEFPIKAAKLPPTDFSFASNEFCYLSGEIIMSVELRLSLILKVLTIG